MSQKSIINKQLAAWEKKTSKKNSVYTENDITTAVRVNNGGTSTNTECHTRNRSDSRQAQPEKRQTKHRNPHVLSLSQLKRKKKRVLKRRSTLKKKKNTQTTHTTLHKTSQKLTLLVLHCTVQYHSTRTSRGKYTKKKKSTHGVGVDLRFVLARVVHAWGRRALKTGRRRPVVRSFIEVTCDIFRFNAKTHALFSTNRLKKKKKVPLIFNSRYDHTTDQNIKKVRHALLLAQSQVSRKSHRSTNGREAKPFRYNTHIRHVIHFPNPNINNTKRHPVNSPARPLRHAPLSKVQQLQPRNNLEPARVVPVSHVLERYFNVRRAVQRVCTIRRKHRNRGVMSLHDNTTRRYLLQVSRHRKKM